MNTPHYLNEEESVCCEDDVCAEVEILPAALFLESLEAAAAEEPCAAAHLLRCLLHHHAPSVLEHVHVGKRLVLESGGKREKEKR